MAQDLDKKHDRAPESASTGIDATCDLAPQDTNPGATCDLAPTPHAAIGDLVTEVYEPSQTPDATCDLGPEPARLGLKTTNVPLQENTLGRPPAPHAGTVDFQPAPTALTPADATCDVAPAPSVEQTKLGAQGIVTQGAPADAMPATGAAPETAGRYVFKKFHAKGGMGEIWLVEDSDIGRPVALKRILKGRVNQRDQFLKEARVTGQLEHPGVIPVHELSLDENDQPYYVMKFVRGQTLKEVIADYKSGKNDAARSRELQLLDLLNVFIKLCETIAYAHSRGVIHRDIKPENVMVGAYGEMLVLDWGLAKVIGEPESADPFATINLLEDSTMASLAGSIKGTPSFFAPEVASGKVDQVDELSDVFLLGGTLFNMITGKPPREGKQKLSKVIEEARTVQPAPPRSFDPTITKPLDAICRKALALKKEDRYSSAAALAEDVKSYLAGDPLAAYRENLLERTARFIKKHRAALGRCAAMVIIVAVIGAAIVVVKDADARRAAAQADADKLKREDDARLQIAAFRKFAEEARYFAASANPVAQGSLAHEDTAKAEARADAAFAIADQWGREFVQLPLADQKNSLRNDIYDLLLEIAQLKSRKSEAHADALKLLGQAKDLRPATQSWYRLHARCLDEKSKAEADADRKLAADPQTPRTSLDYYLLGEQARVDSLQLKEDITEGEQAKMKWNVARREVLNKAIGFYRRALRDDPNHYWSLYQVGACNNGMGSYAEAAQAYGACIAVKPDAPWGYNARGLALSQTKERSAEAVQDFDRALQIDPEFRPARLNRAVYFAQEKKYDEADADFAAVLAEPDDKRLREALGKRGEMFMDRKLFKEARAVFDEAVKEKVGVAAVYLHRVRLSMLAQKPEEALENLNQFLALNNKQFNPLSPQADEQRGRELRRMAIELDRDRREGVYLLALACLQKAAAKNLQTASLFDEIGTIQELLAQTQPKQAAERLDAAITAYSRGLDLAPTNRILLVKRGWTYNNLSQFEEAKADFAAAIAIEKEYSEAYAGLGYVEAMLKEPSLARRHANLAIVYGAGDYLQLHNAACIFGALSKTDPARAREYQDMALDQLHRAVDLWNKGNRKGLNEIDLILAESLATFPPALRARPEFKKLISDNP